MTELTEEGFKTVLNNLCDFGKIWLLIDDKTHKIIGTSTILFEYKFINNGGVVSHIEDIIIKNEYKNKGCGRFLLHFLKKQAQEKGCYKMILNCANEYINFYKKCGFVESNTEMEIRF